MCSENMISLFRKQKTLFLMENLQHLWLTQTVLLSRCQLLFTHESVAFISEHITNNSRKSRRRTLLVSSSPCRNKLKERKSNPTTVKSAKQRRINRSVKRTLIDPECQQKSKSIKRMAATEASSKRKSRPQHHNMFRLAAQSLSVKIPFLLTPTTVNAYCAVAFRYFVNLRFLYICSGLQFIMSLAMRIFKKQMRK
jgi:hypothetical protein